MNAAATAAAWDASMSAAGRPGRELRSVSEGRRAAPKVQA